MHRNWRSLIKPRGIEVEKETLTGTYGKFTAKPLERGFGLTLGNTLRRILLSSLQGAAVIKVKIDDVLHEFSTLPGVKEDVNDILLNLKQLKIKLHEGDEAIIRLDVTGEKVVSAADIQCPSNVEILNPELVLAHLNAEGTIKAEMTVAMGKGYVPAENHKDEEDPLGTL